MKGSLSGRLGFLALAAGLLAVIACERDSNGGASHDSPPITTDGGVEAPPELDGYVQELVSRCESITDDETTQASIHEARAAYKRGDTDIPLSVKGCTRLFVKKSGDRETFSAVLSPPFGITVDQETFEVKRTAAMMSWSTAADGKKEVRGDFDADGFAELRETAVPNVSMLSERVTPSGEIKARTTVKVLEGGLSVDVTEEAEDEDGRLATTATYQGARVARKCTGDPPPGTNPPPTTPPRPASPFPPSPHEVACAPEQLMRLESLLERATSGGESCMAAAGMPDIRARMLHHVTTMRFDFKCTDDPSFVAANDGGYGDVFPGRALLWINPLLFTGQDWEQVSTLYHELMHFSFVHDHQVEALADLSTNLAYADRVYACEQLCFAPKANSCHLAACTNKKICEVAKYEFEQKIGKEIESCWTGHQVGALCRKKPGERQWCTTKSECDAACGGQECESKSISCNENCR